MDLKFTNVILLGFGFMFVFTAFQTMGMIEKTILDSIQAEDSEFTGDGYISLALIYAVFSVSNWLAPSFISATGPRVAMLVGASVYTGFMVTFLFPSNWLLYLASAVLGAAASITWTGQGGFLARCSTKENISQNSGIFWAMLQCSLFFGNLFVFFEFQNKSQIDVDSRRLVIGVLTVVAILGIVFLAVLRYVPDTTERTEMQELSGFGQALYALKAAGRLFITRDMLLLSVCFFYTGIELSFFSGVYGACIGFTKKIHETPKQILGLSGICIGAGEVIGGTLFGILGAKTRRFGRDPIVIAGYIVHIISFVVIFLNLPDNSPFQDTDDISYLDPPIAWLALVCSFSLGFADACYNTQCISMLAGVYRDESIGAFAIFKFTQSVAAAICFFISSKFGLRVQLAILVVVGTIGTICFVIVELGVKKREAKTAES